MGKRKVDDENKAWKAPENETDLPAGLYEQVISEALAERLKKIPAERRAENGIDEGEAPQVLSRYFSKLVEEKLSGIADSPVMCAELEQVLKIQLGRIDFVDKPARVGFECPLSLHCTYTRDQLLTGLGYTKATNVREGVKWLPGRGAVPYTFLGPVNYVRHQGSCPMNILWRLETPIPAKFLKRTNQTAAG